VKCVPYFLFAKDFCKAYIPPMSAQEVETLIRSLPPSELRQFAEWWETHRQDLLNQRATPAPPIESDAVKTELLQRRREYLEHPERFVQMNDAALNQMFHDIENETS